MTSTVRNNQPCEDCNRTFLENTLIQCESCCGFICDDCIQPCGYAGNINQLGEECGGEHSLSHGTHGSEYHNECESYVECTTESFCDNHGEFCADCDTHVCLECHIRCYGCGIRSCIDCGGYCSGCEIEYCHEVSLHAMRQSVQLCFATNALMRIMKWNPVRLVM